jgi:hypothetical protein
VLFEPFVRGVCVGEDLEVIDVADVLARVDLNSDFDRFLSLRS